MKQLLVLAPVSEYRGDRVAKVVRIISSKTPDIAITTSRDIWLRTMPRKPAYVTHSQWRGEGTGFYVNWVSAYRRELAKFLDVLIVPREDGSVGNGTRVDLKHVRNARVNVLVDDRLIPFTKVNKKSNREDKVNTITFSRAPELTRV